MKGTLLARLGALMRGWRHGEFHIVEATQVLKEDSPLPRQHVRLLLLQLVHELVDLRRRRDIVLAWQLHVL